MGARVEVRAVSQCMPKRHRHNPSCLQVETSDVVSPIPEARTQFLKAGIWDDKRAAIAEGGVIAYV